MTTIKFISIQLIFMEKVMLMLRYDKRRMYEVFVVVGDYGHGGGGGCKHLNNIRWKGKYIFYIIYSVHLT